MGDGGPQPIPRLDPWDVKTVTLASRSSEAAHAHSLKAFDWPAWFVENIAPKNDDSAGVKVVKIGAVILSPPVVALLALYGNVVDEFEHIYDLTLEVIGPNIYIGDLPNLIGRAPTASFAASDEAARMKVNGVAYDTAPPVPDRPRARNKCGAAARGGRR